MDTQNELITRFKKLAVLIFVENLNVLLCLLAIAAAGVIVYRKAFGAPFIFDDLTQILENHRIQSLDWPWAFIENNRRPVLYASLAFDFRSHGFNPFGFHVFNVRAHIFSGIMFFFLVRATLKLPSAKELFRQNAELLALASALLWLVHPVHTQAVTYIIQRAESLMAFFFLSSMFFACRYFASKHFSWAVLSSVAALLAGLTKEVALALPVMVLFYDRTFFSVSVPAALRNHRWLYTGLSVTWFVMVYLYLTTSPEARLTAGFGMQGMSPFLYAVNQPAVILHYVGLVFWPARLVFDYDWPAITDLRVLWPSILVLSTWVAVLIAAFQRYRVVSFLMLGFLIILLPSSSIIPLKDLIFEYRIYLSLCCLSVLLVLGFFLSAERFVNERNRHAFFIAVVILLSMILGGLTYQRNKIYANEEILWKDLIRKQPMNARALNNLGEYLMRQGRDREAEPYFLQSLAFNNSYPDVYVNLATVIGKRGKPELAVEYARQALAIDPEFAVAHNNLGSALSQLGRYEEAASCFQKTIELGFMKEGVFINWGVALMNSGEPMKAVKVLKQALVFYPDSEEIKSILSKL